MEQIITMNNFEMYLPYDLIDYIYSKVIYSISEDLLKQIKYRYKIKKYINILRGLNVNDKYSILYDILIVYYSLQHNINYKYIVYNSNYIPNNILNNIVISIENDINYERSNSKLFGICVKYLLTIPYCHIKYIFKRNRTPI
jgi:hypothetical protein